MYQGKKSVAEKIVYDSLAELAKVDIKEVNVRKFEFSLDDIIRLLFFIIRTDKDVFIEI